MFRGVLGQACIRWPHMLFHFKHKNFTPWKLCALGTVYVNKFVVWLKLSLHGNKNKIGGHSSNISIYTYLYNLMKMAVFFISTLLLCVVAFPYTIFLGYSLVDDSCLGFDRWQLSTRVLIKYIPRAIKECGSTLYVGMVTERRWCDTVKQ